MRCITRQLGWACTLPCRSRAQACPRLNRQVCSRAKYAEDHRTFMSEVALLNSTETVPLLMKTLKAQGYSCIPAYRNIGLHPYAIALAEGSFDIWGEEVEGVLCLLRWPDPKEVVNMEMPIAVMGRGERKLRLVARSPTEYTKRVLVEEDRVAGEGGSRPVAAALGEQADDLYAAGNIRNFMYSKPEAFFVKQVGHFPDVSESLMRAHLDKGDETSAMITAEWTMRNLFFSRWGFPFELAAGLYEQLGRREEARDTARLALKQPWWTVDDLNTMRNLAKMTGTVEETAELFEQEAQGGDQFGGPVEQPTPQEIAMKDAKKLMDKVSAGEIRSWDEIRPQLVEFLQAAGQTDCATFVKESTTMSG